MQNLVLTVYQSLLYACALLIFSACTSEETSDRRGATFKPEGLGNSTDNAGAVNKEPGVEWNVVFNSNGFTNQVNHNIIAGFNTYKLNQSHVISAISVHGSLEDPSGQIIYSDEMTGNDTAWTFGLNKGDGVYKIKFSLSGFIEKYTPKPHVIEIHLDQTTPIVEFRGDLVTDVNNGERTVYAEVVSPEAISCDAIKGQGVNGVEFDLAPIEEDYLKQFASLSQDVQEPISIEMQCIDDAGNKMKQVTIVEAFSGFNKLSIQSVPDQVLPDKFDGEDVYFIKSGANKINHQVIDSEKLQPVDQSFIDREKFRWSLVASLNPYNLENEEQEESPFIWKGTYSNQINLEIPNNLSGKQDVYITLIESSIGESKILGHSVIPFFIDDLAYDVSWVSEPIFQKPEMEKVLDLEVLIEGDGAPIDGPGVVEYSIDSQSWNPLEVSNWAQVEGDPSRYKFQVLYPFINEQAFRLQLTITDKSGNTAVSDISPRLVGSDFLDVAVDSDECADKSRLAIKLASRYACQKASFDGSLGGNYYLPIYIENIGSVPMEFFSNDSVSEGLGYSISSGDQIRSERLDVEGTFKDLMPGIKMLYLIPLSAGEVEQGVAKIEFDREASGANSITNSCYQAGTFPQLSADEQALISSISLSPFACSY